MKAKTLVELVALTNNVYSLMKDKEFRDNVDEVYTKGKEKFNDVVDSIRQTSSMKNEEIVDGISNKMHEIGQELEHKMEEIAQKIYKKMHLVHQDEITKLEDRIAFLEYKLQETEKKIDNLHK